MAALAALLVAAVAFSIFNAGIRVSVRNAGSTALHGVVVHVTQRSYPIGDIEPSQRKTVQVCPEGKSSVEIEHSKGRFAIDTYFACGFLWRGRISVDLTEKGIEQVRNDVRIALF